MDNLRFDGKVAVITGAGAGLGKAYALLFASRGAKIVVNDLGGGRHGDGSSSKAADAVVDEIRQNGGIAVADYNSVVDGDKIINTAMESFGRIDILVNNAGILRDKSFARISDSDWDLVQAVHLKGSFKTTQSAFPIFKKQNYGKIIMTSSNSGLYGNFGQANYSAAKMGLVGLANSIAIEGRKNNIHCNVIVPTAASRLTEDILPPDLFAELKPEFIAPVVAWLCHENCSETGSVIESAAGWAGKCHVVRSDGKLLRKSITHNVEIEDVRDSWDSIVNMNMAKNLGSIQEATGALVSSLEGLKEGESVNIHGGSSCFQFEEKDLILYSLSVGASLCNNGDIKYLYENNENFTTVPTFFTTPALMALFTSSPAVNIPGREVSLTNILHGEQYLEFFEKIPLSGKIHSTIEIAELLDKGSGAVIVYNIQSYSESGTLLFKNQIVSFAVGAGGWGGPRNGTNIRPCANKPTRKEDNSVTYITSRDQAALYRLNGDRNPIHIDPDMAAVAGFETPILHGLCSLGISVKIVMDTYGQGDVNNFKALKCRFAKPILPGDSMKVNMWQEANRIYFESVNTTKNITVISGAYVDLLAVNIPETVSSSTVFKSDAVFEFIAKKIKENPEKAKSVNAIFLYNITKDGQQTKQWTMDLIKPNIFEGAPHGTKPNTIVTVSDEDFVSLATGKLNSQTAFMKGKLKIAGNIMLAQKLGPLLKATDAKL